MENFLLGGIVQKVNCLPHVSMPCTEKNKMKMKIKEKYITIYIKFEYNIFK
jgi:hypothetical protein